MDVKEERILINISGTKFETTYNVLERFPGSRLALLATLREDDAAYDSDKREFYFDRHPEVFADILHFYKTEELHIRRNLCGNVIKREFEFWGMFEQDIEPCCWTCYSQASECKDTLAAIDSTFLTGNFAIQAEVWQSEASRWIRFRRRVWSILEDPAAAVSARIYAFVSMFVVISSIVCFVAETYESFRVPIDGANLTVAPVCTRACGVFVDSQSDSRALYYSDDDTEPHPVLRYLDYFMFAFFSVDLSLRLFFAPEFRPYFKDFLNWIDITCVVTHAVSIAMSSIESLPRSYTSTLVKTVLTLRVLRGLRVVRVLRIFKLVKHYNAFRILVYTIKISLRELMLMIVFLFVGAIIFGSIVHLVERDSFRNIPYGLWWALVTMTTVGYGDFVPRQAAGYAIGCVCVIFGVLTIAFTVPIVVNNFALYYTHAQSRNKKPREYWRIKRVPQNRGGSGRGSLAGDLAGAPRPQTPPTMTAETKLDFELDVGAVDKLARDSLPTKSQLYGDGGSDGRHSVATTTWNNFNNDVADRQEDNVGSSDFNESPRSATPAAAAAKTPVRGVRRGEASGLPEPEEARILKERARILSENEERSRQMLAQAQESAEQMDQARETQAAAIQLRKDAIKQRKSKALANLARKNQGDRAEEERGE